MRHYIDDEMSVIAQPADDKFHALIAIAILIRILRPLILCTDFILNNYISTR